MLNRARGKMSGSGQSRRFDRKRRCRARCQRKFFIVALIYCALGIAGTMQVSRAAPLALQGVGLSGAGSSPTQSKHAAVSCLVKTAHDKADIINHTNKSVPACVNDK
jgi:hypothetical protein